MPVLSDRFKHAFKVALAMVVTYGIALSMDWDKPFWAALSVAFSSLATTGDSINRGLQRVIGTLAAGVATLALVALFPQDRWPFLIAMSAFIAFCNYRLSAGSRFYFIWFAAGFSVPIMAILGGAIGANSFSTVILRAQETILGVVVYSLVAVLLWPRRGGAEFESAARGVCDVHRQIFGRYLQMLAGKPDDGGAARLRAQLTGQLAGLGERLEGAVYDSDEIWEVRHAWRRCIRELFALSNTLERWRLGFDELRDLDLQRFMPGFADFHAEVEARFGAIESMLAGQPPPRQPDAFELRLDLDQLSTLSHFQRAAVVLCHEQLLRIERLTEELFETVSDIRGHSPAKAWHRFNAQSLPSALIDLDRIAATVRQSTALWLTLLMAIYVPGFPNVVGVVALTNAFAMIFSLMPHVQPSVLLLPAVAGTLFGGGLYLLVMPHMSGFGELGVMIFLATFLIGYVFHQPQAVVAKSMGLCMLVIMIGVDNQQNYNFLYFANWFETTILFVMALMVAWRFPISFRAEDRFLAMLGRFFRSAEYLISTAQRDTGGKTSWLSRQRSAFHLHEVMVLPQKLRAWGRALPPAALSNTGPEQVQSLLTSLQALSDRMQALLEAQLASQSEILAHELRIDMQDWRTGIRKALVRLSAAPGMADPTAFRSKVDARLAQLEARVEETLENNVEADVSSEERVNMYRLLGAYRGLSEALVDLAKRVSPVNWTRIQEARF